MKTLILTYTLLFLCAVQSFALAKEPKKLWIEVREKKSLYVEYYEPKQGQPTLVILNGLTYSTRQWDQYVANLLERGVGVVAYDMDGQGQTLLKYAPAVAPFPVKTQISDLKVLLEKLSIQAPYNLVGLSYGGGVGIGFALENPKLVKNLILMAPYTRPLAKLDDWIKSQIWATRTMFPLNKTSDDDLYDYFYHQIVYATYPQSEPVVLENPFKLEAVYRLGQGIRKYVPQDFVDQLEVPVHLLVARVDQYIPAEVLEDLWTALPAKHKMSRLFVSGSEHKIPEAVPAFSAAWTYQILVGNKSLLKGKDFEGLPFQGIAKSGEEVINLTKSH